MRRAGGRRGQRPDPPPVPTVVRVPADQIASFSPGDAIHRPLPGSNAWPDAAVLLTYAEIRRLIALHLDNLSRTMGHTHPWTDARRTAEAMRAGETPLLLSEVLGES